MSRRTPWIVPLVGAVLVIALALVGNWARRRSEGGCALDGVTIDPLYRVEVVDARGRDCVFCCVRCAELWLANQPPPRAITVTDENTGERVDAASAYYVRSLVVTTPTTGNRIHVFRTLADAKKHAAECQGTVLSEEERPFP